MHRNLMTSSSAQLSANQKWRCCPTAIIIFYKSTPVQSVETNKIKDSQEASWFFPRNLADPKRQEVLLRQVSSIFSKKVTWMMSQKRR